MKLSLLSTTALSLLLVACSDGVKVAGPTDNDDTQAPVTNQDQQVAGPTNTQDNNDAQGQNDQTDTNNNNDTNNADQNTTPDNVTTVPPANQQNTMYGFVNFTHLGQQNFAVGGASFVEYPAALVADIEAQLAPPQADQCLVVDSQNPDASETLTTVSAGEVLTVTSNAGTYMQLMRGNFDGTIFYSSEPAFISGELPASLTVDIPGDVFPAFANVQSAPVQALNVIAPTINDAVTTNTAFSWTAGNSAESTINLSGFVTNSAGTLSFSCRLVDDGNFSIPADIQNQLGGNGVALTTDISRTSQTVTRNGNAVLIVSTGSNQ